MNEKEIKKHLADGESDRCEFKEVAFKGKRLKSPGKAVLADELAALANFEGGVMLCGVTDDGDVQGMSREEVVALVKVVDDVINDTIKPPLNVRYSTVKHKGKSFLAVEVPEGEALHDSPKGPYIRRGATKRKMSRSESQRLSSMREQAGVVWYDKLRLPGIRFNDLDESLWMPLLGANSENPKDSLRKMGLLSQTNGKKLEATVAGVLLCTKNPQEWLPNAGITAVHYRGKRPGTEQMDAMEIDGPLNEQVASAMKFVKMNMRVAAVKIPGRLEFPQYSLKAVFEAVVNAVAHRDYSIKGSKIRLTMFQDRMEILSPGALPNSLVVEDIQFRQSTRNEAIASVFSRMLVEGVQGGEHRAYFMERRGEGMPIIIDETLATSGKDPDYRLIGGTDLVVTIPSADQDPSPTKSPVSVIGRGKPVKGADLLALFPRKSWARDTTEADGVGVLDLPTSKLPMTVFFAAKGYAAKAIREWVPAEQPLSVKLDPLTGGGSVIFTESEGEIPGLKGTLAVELDNFGRLRMYAGNMTIDGAMVHPVPISLGKSYVLEDFRGTVVHIKVLEIIGKVVLVEYSKPKL